MSTRSTTATSSEPGSLAECFDRFAFDQHGSRPISTYRLQFHANFRFEDALKIVPYLDSLGISHFYASPILKARSGSMHGYDITDHNTINPDIGTEEEFRQLVAELNARDMGLVLDTVPNHMGVGHGGNPWWQDVLENGPASEYASFFDIDWHPVKVELSNKVLIPILGDQYGAVLESGQIRLVYGEGRFRVQYYDKPLPIDPQTYSMIFEPLGDLRERQSATGISDEERSEVENILWDLRQLPRHSNAAPEACAARRAQIPELLRRLDSLVSRSAAVRKLIDLAVSLCNGEPGNPHSFDALHRLLEAQAYRLAHWRVSAQEINYRRFFDINDLVGLRMENPQVFAATHRLIRRLLAEGLVDGIRLDHPDGLLNPLQYFTRVQMLYVASQCCGPDPSGPVGENGIENEIQDLFRQHDWGNTQPPLYVLVEKILEHGEELPCNWPVDGTVGYEFTNLVNGIFIDQRNEHFFTNLYRRITGSTSDVESLVYESKRLIMRTSLSSEITVLTHLLEEIASTDRHARDFTRPALTDCIREVIACFPVYRTYIDERGNVSERDRAYITESVSRAKRRNRGTTTDAIFDFLKNILLLNSPDGAHIEAHRDRLNFTLKFQQLTGPVMAKGLEDTVCYVYNRFISANEVGGSPAIFGVSTDDFHAANLERSRHWPNSMLATSTHDTKRSEDVRARLDVLSEMPRSWAAQAIRWRRINRARKRAISDGRLVPDANEEYLLYQTLVGAWQLDMATKAQRDDFTARIKAYMNKAVHEAKVNLSWVNQNPEYVEALEHFIERILHPGTAHRPNVFVEQIENFIPAVAYFGAMNSISQTLLKITAPGVPDTYQGNELWDFSLVDPDNRRPVDFNLRLPMLEELTRSMTSTPLTELCEELLSHFHDGRVKLWTTMRALNFRREHAELFQHGSYIPLRGTGEARAHLVAFAREHNGQSFLVAAPRLSYTLMKGQVGAPVANMWGDSELIVGRAAAEYVNIFTEEVLRSSDSGALLCRELFAHFPLALLVLR